MHIHPASWRVKLILPEILLYSPAPISTQIFFTLLLPQEECSLLVSSQIRPACPCSRKKGLSCKGSDRPYQEKEIHLTKIVLFAAKVSLQQFVSSLTDGYSHPLARYNNVCNICIHLNLSVLITFTQAAHSAETNLISTTDE